MKGGSGCPPRKRCRVAPRLSSPPIGANPEVAAGLGDRFVTRSTNPLDIAATVIDVLGDPVMLAAKRAETRSLVHPRFDWDTVADAYLEANDDLPKRQQPRQQRSGR